MAFLCFPIQSSTAFSQGLLGLPLFPYPILHSLLTESPWSSSVTLSSPPQPSHSVSLAFPCFPIQSSTAFSQGLLGLPLFPYPVIHSLLTGSPWSSSVSLSNPSQPSHRVSLVFLCFPIQSSTAFSQGLLGLPLFPYPVLHSLLTESPWSSSVTLSSPPQPSHSVSLAFPCFPIQSSTAFSQGLLGLPLFPYPVLHSLLTGSPWSSSVTLSSPPQPSHSVSLAFLCFPIQSSTAFSQGLLGLLLFPYPVPHSLLTGSPWSSPVTLSSPPQPSHSVSLAFLCSPIQSSTAFSQGLLGLPLFPYPVLHSLLTGSPWSSSVSLSSPPQPSHSVSLAFVCLFPYPVLHSLLTGSPWSSSVSLSSPPQPSHRVSLAFLCFPIQSSTAFSQGLLGLPLFPYPVLHSLLTGSPWSSSVSLSSPPQPSHSVSLAFLCFPIQSAFSQCLLGLPLFPYPVLHSLLTGSPWPSSVSLSSPPQPSHRVSLTFLCFPIQSSTAFSQGLLGLPLFPYPVLHSLLTGSPWSSSVTLSSPPQPSHRVSLVFLCFPIQSSTAFSQCLLGLPLFPYPVLNSLLTGSPWPSSVSLSSPPQPSHMVSLVFFCFPIQSSTAFSQGLLGLPLFLWPSTFPSSINVSRVWCFVF